MTRLPLQPLKLASYFNERIHIDTLTNLPLNPLTMHRHVMVIVDAFSGFMSARPLKSLQASEVMSILMDDWLPHHGCPDEIYMDNGSENAPRLVKVMEEELQIKCHYTTPGHSMGNSLAERAIRSLLAFVRSYIHSLRISPSEWDSYLSSFCLIHNSLKGVRGFAPLTLATGVRPRLPFTAIAGRKPRYSSDPFMAKLETLHKLSKITKSKQEIAQKTNKKFYDQHMHVPDFKPGDLAYVMRGRDYKSKLAQAYMGPFLIVKVHFPYVTLQSLEDSSAPSFQRHLNEVRKGFWRHGTNFDPGATDSRREDPQMERLPPTPPDSDSDLDGDYDPPQGQGGGQAQGGAIQPVPQQPAGGPARGETVPAGGARAQHGVRSSGLPENSAGEDPGAAGAAPTGGNNPGSAFSLPAHRSTRANPGELIPMRDNPARPPTGNYWN